MRFYRSISYALKGIFLLLRTERNFQIQAVVALLVICAGTYFQVQREEWVILLFCIGLVMTFEAMNTAIERTLDKLYPDHDPLVGHIKDIAAGSVLLASVVSVCIGMLVFWDYVFGV